MKVEKHWLWTLFLQKSLGQVIMTKLWACVQPCHPLGEPLFRVCPYPEFSLFSPSSPPFPVTAAHACFQSASRMVGTDTGSLTISGNFPPPSNSPAPDSSADKPGVQCGTSGIFPVIGHRALLLHAVLLSPVPTLTLSHKKKKGSNSQPFSQKLQGKKRNNPLQVLWGHTWCKKKRSCCSLLHPHHLLSSYIIFTCYLFLVVVFCYFSPTSSVLLFLCLSIKNIIRPKSAFCISMLYITKLSIIRIISRPSGILTLENIYHLDHLKILHLGFRWPCWSLLLEDREILRGKELVIGW